MQSRGGDWNDGMAIFDAIRATRSHVTILAYAHARSMTSIIFQAADQRVIMPNCIFLAHQGFISLDDRVEPALIELEQLKIQNETMLNIYTERCVNGKFFKKVEMKEKQVKNFIRKKIAERKSINKLFPTFPDRVKKVADKGGLHLRDTNEDTWFFKVHSGTEAGKEYDAVVHFKEVNWTLEKLVKDRRLWVKDKSRVDMRKLANKFFSIADIEILCSCPAFQYYGPAYILSKDKYDAKYSDRETRPPKKRNPKQYGAYCKHYANVMRVLPFYKTTLAKWLKDFHADEISKFEEEAKEEFGWITKAAVALKKRKEEEPKKKKAVKKKIKKKLPKEEPEIEPKEKPEPEEPIEEPEPEEEEKPKKKKKEPVVEPEEEPEEGEEPKKKKLKKKKKKEEPEEDEDEAPTIEVEEM
jgi:hypothetical protein